MQPVRQFFGEHTHLLISPDGEMNLLPFAALIDEHGQYLIQRYAVTYLTGGRDLLRMGLVRKSKTPPLLIANPLFGEPDTRTLAGANAASNVDRSSVTTASDLSGISFAPLSSTEQEARSIQGLFPEAVSLMGSQATESALKGLVAPRILHIATHGFFLSEPGGAARGSRQTSNPRGSSANATLENPLLRSGLALAGANLPHNNKTEDDGILTALEASGLNLWGTKLVVLSACDTGVGEVHNGEGVYGLRRAFVLAGTESLVMSLWPVSDYTTRELMTHYYQNLKLGMGRGESLRQVQLDMLKKNPHLHPFYWANFIQAGEWANLDGKR
jgi:CHAT domain-containing protein